MALALLPVPSPPHHVGAQQCVAAREVYRRPPLTMFAELYFPLWNGFFQDNYEDPMTRMRSQRREKTMLEEFPYQDGALSSLFQSSTGAPSSSSWSTSQTPPAISFPSGLTPTSSRSTAKSRCRPRRSSTTTMGNSMRRCTSRRAPSSRSSRDARTASTPTTSPLHRAQRTCRMRRYTRCSLQSSWNSTPRGSRFNHTDFYSMVRNSNSIAISLSPRHSNYGNIVFDVKSTGPRANSVAAYLALPANGIARADEEEGQWGGRREVISVGDRYRYIPVSYRTDTRYDPV
ncbi:PIN-like protein [Canna indica]|uniref:PIN-like protein n=1 Tax=Canna indica TaxID=4628 RepID=A0AAQ3JRA8_9LILI|nr:PIN-like protein [Canna indica]